MVTSYLIAKYLLLGVIGSILFVAIVARFYSYFKHISK